MNKHKRRANAKLQARHKRAPYEAGLGYLEATMFFGLDTPLNRWRRPQKRGRLAYPAHNQVGLFELLARNPHIKAAMQERLRNVYKPEEEAPRILIVTPDLYQRLRHAYDYGGQPRAGIEVRSLEETIVERHTPVDKP